MESFKLNDGHSIPAVGLGTWQSKPGEVENAVEAAVEAGYRHIDCAHAYQNETEVGAGLQKVLLAGKVKREELFIVSKLWNTQHHPEDVKPSLKQSLAKLGLNYLDLYLIHWPISFQHGKGDFPKDENGKLLYDNVHYLDTWKALEECVKEGLVKSIGLSNFNHQQLKEIIDNSTIKPAVLQVEVNPHFQQQKLVKFCQEHGVVVTAFSSLGSPGRPWAGKSEGSLLDNSTLVSIGKNYKKTSAQVILRWLFQRNIVSIPKSVTPSRIQQNIQIFDFTLTTDEMERIKSLDENIRLIIPLVDCNGKKEARDKDAPFFPWNDPNVF